MLRLQQLQQNLDAKARAKGDPDYIEVPEKPWAVVLKSNANDMDLRSTTRMTAEQFLGRRTEASA